MADQRAFGNPDRSLAEVGAQVRDRAQEAGAQVRDKAQEAGAQIRDKAQEMVRQGEETASAYYQQGRQQMEGFCRKVRFLGQNRKIGYQKFNDLQTAKISKKQLCDRTRA